MAKVHVVKSYAFAPTIQAAMVGVFAHMFNGVQYRQAKDKVAELYENLATKYPESQDAYISVAQQLRKAKGIIITE